MPSIASCRRISCMRLWWSKFSSRTRSSGVGIGLLNSDAVVGDCEADHPGVEVGELGRHLFQQGPSRGLWAHLDAAQVGAGRPLRLIQLASLTQLIRRD